MSKNKKSYHRYRLLTVCLTSFMLPMGTFVGYEFGSGHVRNALFFLGIQTGLTFIQSYVWWFTLEKENS